ncbi:uncharacterized protein LOC110859898 isoform X2 [Folsomia candida]|nr:uncharacterized protein LOC110859898 isoform X2 [Folsomia candida]
MSFRVVGLVLAVFGLAVVITSSLVLYDAVQHINRQREMQHAPYIKYGYDVFWDSFKFDTDILAILASLAILVGIVQMIMPAIFCCRTDKDMRKSIKLWIGTNSILIFLALSCFVLGMVYRIDTVGVRTTHYNGRQSNTYLSSWWRYDKGQAYLGALGIDVFVLIGVIVWMVRWMLNPANSNNAYNYE